MSDYQLPTGTPYYSTSVSGMRSVTPDSGNNKTTHKTRQCSAKAPQVPDNDDDPNETPFYNINNKDKDGSYQVWDPKLKMWVWTHDKVAVSGSPSISATQSKEPMTKDKAELSKQFINRKAELRSILKPENGKRYEEKFIIEGVEFKLVAVYSEGSTTTKNTTSITKKNHTSTQVDHMSTTMENSKNETYTVSHGETYLPEWDIHLEDIVEVK